ncbi:sensor domain-containing diguanylate cyclase [Fusicatenibacter sp.]
MRRSGISNRKKWKWMVCLTIMIVVVALFLQEGILMYVNSKNANKTSQMLLDQVMSVIQKNQQSEEELIQAMKEDYIVRTKGVAYLLDVRPDVEYNVSELQKIANLMSVDEIHLLDDTGTIYSGSVPMYYGYSFDSGEQMAYFKPMLENKELTMCQDVTPNTSEGKCMMYAIIWNSTGTKMVQVGVAPVRLLEKLKQNEVSTVVGNMPMYQGMKLYVADKETHEVYGATNEEEIGKKLEALGISKKFLDQDGTKEGILRIRGSKYNCVFEEMGKYLVGVTFESSADHESNMMVILLVAVYLGIVSGLLMFLVSRVLKANREKKEQYDILSSMAEIYYRMYLVDLKEDTVTVYSDQSTMQESGKVYKNADRRMHEIMAQTVLETYEEQADRFVDLHTVAERMRGKKIISGEFVGKQLGWFRASFVTIEADINEKTVKAIFSIQSIESEKRKEEDLIETSNTDELTGCLNRRAYEKDIARLKKETEFIYVSMDVNGLKIVNDSLGHAAGDELLKGASYCIRKAFEDYGKVYRIGGDEFVAIVFTTPERFGGIRKEFEQTVENWTGEQIESMTISYGIVTSKEKKWESISEMAYAADIRMYEKKALYYSRHGVDRRGQPAAYIALCKRYPKVLKIDLNQDTFRVLGWKKSVPWKVGSAEKTADAGIFEKMPAGPKGEPEGCLSNWLKQLADSGEIHPDDLSNYRNRTDLAYIRNYLDQSREALGISCRRKAGDNWMETAIEIIAGDEYTEENRIAFLYIKMGSIL